MPTYIREPLFDEQQGRQIDQGIIKCDTCGRAHQLERSDSVCRCGQLYNAFGQRLNPVNQWSEEY
jgi:hypothetical protein